MLLLLLLLLLLLCHSCSCCYRVAPCHCPHGNKKQEALPLRIATRSQRKERKGYHSDDDNVRPRMGFFLAFTKLTLRVNKRSAAPRRIATTMTSISHQSTLDTFRNH
jgi:hypothetical protein